jgi:hypothetical protein
MQQLFSRLFDVLDLATLGSVMLASFYSSWQVLLALQVCSTFS